MPLPPDAPLRLLTVLQNFMAEWRPTACAFTLDSHLERDLGLDSLARTECLQRVEAAFGVRLGDQAFLAETPREWLSFVQKTLGDTPIVEGSTTAPVCTPVAFSAPLAVQTLASMLEAHATRHPQRVAIQIEDTVQRPLTFANLYEGAERIAAGLQSRGLLPHQTVALMLPTGADYFWSFFGIILAGGVPVPIYPPTRPSQLEEHLRRHVHLLNNAEAFALITVPEALSIARLLQSQVDSLRHVVTAFDVRADTALPFQKVVIRPDDLAFLQYTSGSTGDPKGVMLTHANVIANVRAMGQRVGITSEDVFVSWLPLYHDMGLIGACFGSLYHAAPLVVMSPLRFLARPLRWLQAISEHRGTLSAAPNFAYDLCVRAAQNQSLEGLDLQSWRLAFNGAEPVNAATLARFNAHFSAYGLRPEALTPVYGLAECSVGLALPTPGRIAPIDRVERAALMRTGVAISADPTDDTALPVPGCGQALSDHQIRVVDAQGRELQDRHEGRVEFKGPSATTGYYRYPAATARLFPHGDDWRDTGDRGYLCAGEIYLTGRVKEMIIRGGRNFYPYELEQAVGDVPGLRKGCVAVFASKDRIAGAEKLIVVAEKRPNASATARDLTQRIQQLSVEVLGASVDEIVLVPPHHVLKTSSGKIRREAMRELYKRGALQQPDRALWRQLLRIGLDSAWARLRRALRSGQDGAYAAWVWACFGSVAPMVWVGLMLLPTEKSRWRLAHAATRVLAHLSGVALTVKGRSQLPDGPYILVANHASFLDVYVLTSALPRPVHFVAKAELQKNVWLSVPLKRMGVLFVDRFDRERSVEDAQKLVEVARSGRSLAFFPEGTFTRQPGLLPFRMGAFVAAAQAQVPVVPVSIRGTRSMLRDGSWQLRKGAITVEIGLPICSEGQDWGAAVQLRDAARRVILSGCGEPDRMI